MKKLKVLSLFDWISCWLQALKDAWFQIDKYYASEIDKSAIAISQKNHKRWKWLVDLGDVTKIEWDELWEIDLLLGWSPCFMAWTKILTDNWYKNIEDIIVWDNVLTHNQRYKKVKNIWWTKKRIWVISWDLITLTYTTWNHPYYICQKTDVINQLDIQPKWINVEDIVEWDYAWIPLKELRKIRWADFLSEYIEWENYIKNNILWVPISHIEQTDIFDKQVYNIEVEDDNSYIANNIIVHNCQWFSTEWKLLNFDHPWSKLFFEYVRLLKKIKPKYFLLENVTMNEEYRDIITKELGVEPIKIDSILFVPQTRARMYWTNIPMDWIPVKPKTHKRNYPILNITKKDYNIWNFIEKDVDEKYFISEKTYSDLVIEKNESENYLIVRNGCSAGQVKAVPWDFLDVIYPKSWTRRWRVKDWHIWCLTTSKWQALLLKDLSIRYLTPSEVEQTQWLPKNYTKLDDNTDAQRYRWVWNGWTVDVISYILLFMK